MSSTDSLHYIDKRKLTWQYIDLLGLFNILNNILLMALYDWYYLIVFAHNVL